MIGPFRLQRQQRGFTLIEMIIVCAIISILLGVMVPIYRIHILHANEAVLKEDLYNMRQAIDQYTQDKGKAPQALDDIVSAGYLHAHPQRSFYPRHRFMADRAGRCAHQH